MSPRGGEGEVVVPLSNSSPAPPSSSPIHFPIAQFPPQMEKER